MKITDDQRQNLTKLADYLHAMPEEYARTHFLMATYAACFPKWVVEHGSQHDFYEGDGEYVELEDFKDNDNGDVYAELAPKNFEKQENSQYVCGTCACAIGHGPAAGILPIDVDSDWDRYSFRVFGLSQNDYTPNGFAIGGSENSEIWETLFGPENEDDPKAVATRIREFLKDYE